MNLDLGIIEEGFRNAGRGAAAPDRADGASGFSRLLARQLGSEPGVGKNEDSAANQNNDRETSKIEERNSRPDDQRDSAARNPRAENPGPNRAAKEESGNTAATQESKPLPLGLASLNTQGWPIGSSGSVGLMTAGIASGTGLTEVPVTIQSRLAGEIAARFSDQNGVQNLSLKLNPDHLGKVEVTLLAKGDHLSVQITAGSREAETALRENLRDLTDAIQNKSGRFQQVDVKVDLKSGENHDPLDAEKDERRNDQGQGRENGQDKESNRHMESNQDKNPDTGEDAFAAESGMPNQEG